MDAEVTSIEDLEEELAGFHSQTTEIEGLLQDELIDWDEVLQKLSELETSVEAAREYAEAKQKAESNG